MEIKFVIKLFHADNQWQYYAEPGNDSNRLRGTFNPGEAKRYDSFEDAFAALTDGQIQFPVGIHQIDNIFIQAK